MNRAFLIFYITKSNSVVHFLIFFKLIKNARMRRYGGEAADSWALLDTGGGGAPYTPNVTNARGVRGAQCDYWWAHGV